MTVMKRLIYIILLLIIAGSSGSCDKNDPFKDTVEMPKAPEFDLSDPIDVKRKQMYDTYGKVFKHEFPLSEFTYNWSGELTYDATWMCCYAYTPAKPQYVIPVIDSIDNWVLKLFPTEFIKTYLPINILLTDSIGNGGQDWSWYWDEDIQDYVDVYTPVPQLYDGFISTNYSLFGHVSSRFEDLKNSRELKQSWLSLAIEKMLDGKLPQPTAFVAISEVGYRQYNYPNNADVITLYGILKTGRTKRTGPGASYPFSKTTPAQDFGDFVAFIVYTPEAEKQSYYAKNSKVEEKVNLVKEYFLDNFNITLPYKPVEP